MPRDAVLMGSVACTVGAKLRKGGTYSIILVKIILAGNGKELLNSLKNILESSGTGAGYGNFCWLFNTNNWRSGSAWKFFD